MTSAGFRGDNVVAVDMGTDSKDQAGQRSCAGGHRHRNFRFSDEAWATRAGEMLRFAGKPANCGHKCATVNREGCLLFVTHSIATSTLYALVGMVFRISPILNSVWSSQLRRAFRYVARKPFACDKEHCSLDGLLYVPFCSLVASSAHFTLPVTWQHLLPRQ